MDQKDLLALYNYDEFSEEKYSPWMNFDQSPPLMETGPDFPLWRQDDQSEVRLSEIWKEHQYTVIEFGSFT